MPDEEIDIDEQLAEKAKATKRHKELKDAIKESFGKIATALSQPNEDKAIVDAIKKQGESLDKVAAAIQNQPKPEVKVELSNKEILPLLKEIKEGNDKLLKAIENKNVVESFDFQYDNWGGIKTAKVNYKNQISKPKYQA